MARIPFSDPAWKTTFPFLVEPRANEWLVGLLLHCDLRESLGKRNDPDTSVPQK